MPGPANALNISQEGLVYFDGTNTFSGVDASTAGFVPISSGTGVAPTFQPPSITFSITPVNSGNTPYTVVYGTDQYIECDPTAAPLTVLLPNTAPANATFIVKDSTGQAAINNITVTTPGGTQTIDGSTSITMATAYESLCFIYDATLGVYSISNAANQSSGGGGGITSISTDNGTATPSSGVVSLVGGGNGSAGSFVVQAGGTVFFTASGNQINLQLTDSNNNTCLGANSGNVSISGSNNTTIGIGAGHFISSGSSNAFLGNSAGMTITSGNYNAVVGTSSLSNGHSSSYNSILGTTALSLLFGGSYNIAIGYQSGNNYSTTESSNILIGNAGNIAGGESNVIRIGTQGTGSGQQNLCFIAGIYGVTPPSPQMVTIDSTGNLGSQAIPSGGSVTFTGDTGTPFSSSSVTIETGLASYANGTCYFNASTPDLIFNTVDSSNNVLYGPSGGGLAFTSAANNIAFGSGNLVSLISGSSNVVFGKGLNYTTTGSFNTAIGYLTIEGNNGSYNVGLGYDALSQFSSTVGSVGSYNTVLGANAGKAYTTGESSNILIGYNVAGTISESNVLRIGVSTGNSTGQIAQGSAFIQGIYGASPSSPQMVTISSDGNLGSQAIPSGGSVTFTGNAGTPFSGSAVTIQTAASNGTALFTASTPSLTLTFSDSNNNTALGGNAFSTISGTPGANTAFGLNALAGIAGGGPVSGSNNTGIGLNAILRLSSGSDNTGIGQSTLTLMKTGSSNIAIGSTAGSGVAAANNNTISIGSTGVAGGGSGGETVIGYVLNDTGTSTQTACYIDGIAGVSVGTAAVLITAGGKLGVGVSSARYKDNIKDMGDLSSSLQKLRPVTFTLKSNPELGTRTGLIAEEVAKIMPSLVRYNKNGAPEGVHYQDLPALLLNEVQKLRKELDKLKQKVG